MLLVKNGNIPKEMALKINIGLAVILTVVSAVRIWLNRYSQSSVMSKQNFVLDRFHPTLYE